jgi:hypothetical protein
MSLLDDANRERNEAVEALGRIVAAINDVGLRLQRGEESAMSVLRLWDALKHGPDMLAAVGAMSRAAVCEGAAKAVAIADLQEAAERALWTASEDRWRVDYSSRTWDKKTLAAGGGHDD